MKKLVAFLLFGAWSLVLNAQYKVPAKMEFAGVKLSLNSSAQKEIQGYVNNLTKNASYHARYVDLANIFFPVIEEVFNEEGFPTDFKYLIIQESAFKSDVVSKSNAVGYWQMKKPTAQEVGLRVDGQIDERKNIVAASRGAAKYIKRSNGRLDNWVYGLLSYYLGPTGVLKELKTKDVGAKKMDITGKTHWYVKKCLAHKIAFQNDVYKSSPPISLLREEDCSGKSVKQIAKKHSVDQTEMMVYNKWISYGRKIPSDKTYVVVVPVPYKGKSFANKPKDNSPSIASSEKVYEPIKEEKAVPGSISEVYENPKENIRYTVNGVSAIVAVNGDKSSTLANLGGITKEKFLKYNEIKSYSKIKAGQTYYLASKRGRALVAYHVVLPGETLWSISQKYGMKKKAVIVRNRFKKNEKLKPGRVLWLKAKRPKDVKVEYRKVKPEPVKDDVVPRLDDHTKESKREEIVVVTKNEHRVQAGETLYALSRLYNVPVSDLKSWNNLKSNELSVGNILIVAKPNQTKKVSEPEAVKVEKVEKPKQETEKVVNKGIVHVVQVGETLYAISRKYNVSVDEIKKMNNLSSNELSVGQGLKITR